MARALILCALQLLAFSATTTLAQKRVVCYYSSWVIYRPGDGQFNVSNIDPALCTHLIYAFIGANPNGTVKINDVWGDVSLNGYKNFNNLRTKFPALKTLVALGGWNEGSSTFSAICNNPTLRATFVNNLFNFVVQWGFNGLDLDWEYPAQRGGIAADKANFVSLIKELKVKFIPKSLLLSAAVGAMASALSVSYDVAALSANLDFISLMNYDYHGSWEAVTGHNAPLYANPTDVDKTANVDASVKLWIKMGAAPAKLNLGVPLYGRSFTLKDTASTGMGAPATGAGTAGQYSQEAGFLMYSEICVSQRGLTCWKTGWNAAQAVPFASFGNQWVGYDDKQSVAIKSQYARDQKLGGVMVWSLEGDDFRNSCGGGKYPLLYTLKANFTAA